MRPARVVPFLGELVSADGQATEVWSFADVGYEACPYGVVLGLPSGARVYVQVVSVPAPTRTGAASEQPVHGAPPPPMSPVVLPSVGLTALTNVERYLGGLVAGAGCTEVARVELFADRVLPGAVPHGLTVWFHNGSRVHLYVRHCVPPGRSVEQYSRPFHRLDRV